MKKVIKILLLIFSAFGFATENTTYLASSQINNNIIVQSKKSLKIDTFYHQNTSLYNSQTSKVQKALPRFLRISYQDFSSSNGTTAISPINFQETHQLYMLFQQIIVYC